MDGSFPWNDNKGMGLYTEGRLYRDSIQIKKSFHYYIPDNALILMKLDLSQQVNKNGVLSYKIDNDDDKQWKIAFNDIDINGKYVLSLGTWDDVSFDIIQ